MKLFFNRIGRGKPWFWLLLAGFTATSVVAGEIERKPMLLHAARVFDGYSLRTNSSVLVANGRIAQVDTRGAFDSVDAQVIDLGDATLLPGLIELHAHLSFQQIPADTVLRHGITTLRDVGGTPHKPYGGDGSLRVLTSGLIITAPGGYPIPSLGDAGIAIAVATEEEARAAVRRQIGEGAVVIKVALESGGEAGAPWSSGHGHYQPHASHRDPASHVSPQHPAWPLLPENIVEAIVDEAHRHGRNVTAHIGEAKGAELAINAGIDEWAHVPCDAVPDELLKKAVARQVKVVTTIDTLSKCAGVAQNVNTLAALGAEFLYGAEVAHPDIPWGINAQELIHMMRLAKMEPIDVLRAATSKAGRHLNMPLLGTLRHDAPADMIAVKGDPFKVFKILEYPDLVMSGGKIVVNNFQ